MLFIQSLSLGLLVVTLTSPSLVMSREISQISWLDSLANQVVAQSTALGYGDPCTYESEGTRRDIFASLVNLYTIRSSTSQNGTLTLLSNVLDSLKSFVQSGQKFCNTLKLLTCDKGTQTCSCGEPSLVGVIVKKTYAIEQTQGGESICRWSRGSGCVTKQSVLHGLRTTEEQFDKLYGYSYDSSCEAGTQCGMTGDNGECTTENMVKRVVELAKKEKDLSFAKILELIHSGKLCSCEGSGARVEGSASVNDEPKGPEEDAEIIARRKRELMMETEIDPTFKIMRAMAGF